MATLSSVLAWRIPGTAEPGGLPSMGSHRVGHDWSDLAAAACWFIIWNVRSWLLVPFNHTTFFPFIHMPCHLMVFYHWTLVVGTSNPCSDSGAYSGLLCIHAKLLLCDSMDCSPLGSSVHEIFQARILEWVAISFSRGSSQPRDRTRVYCTAGRFFTNPHLYYPIFSGLFQNSLVNSILIFLTGILLDKTVHYEINIPTPLSH